MVEKQETKEEEIKSEYIDEILNQESVEVIQNSTLINP